ncbi:hypothetical protein PAAG_03428 [Paracoccidioides lutzii Pb01]|uniref:Uncharacterized protein n=1 Tax=Paracoccidioides lutzii (strain ATCC MYA-826 / Pb01) TaxID=502779 RepID=C1GX54_PARBA|nr:hypothetical protein PAAG_03428 [Paracoccidioides lutzii Pb01]EEH41142.2 hypothetical protein PAAG_03428 [Paracoccidioides lutzii Pb01]
MTMIPKAGMAPSPSKLTIRWSGNSMWHRINDKEDFVLNETTYTPEKEDKAPRGERGSEKVFWPAKDLLEEYVDSFIGYSHPPEQN